MTLRCLGVAALVDANAVALTLKLKKIMHVCDDPCAGDGCRDPK